MRLVSFLRKHLVECCLDGIVLVIGEAGAVANVKWEIVKLNTIKKDTVREGRFVLLIWHIGFSSRYVPN